MLASLPGGQLPLQATCTATHPSPRRAPLQLQAGLRPLWPRVPGINLPPILTNSVFCTPSCLGAVFPSLSLSSGGGSTWLEARRCSGEKWKGIKLNRGRVTFPGAAGCSTEAGPGAGGGSSGLRGAQVTQGSRRARQPAKTSSHHGRQVRRGGRGPRCYLRPPRAFSLPHIRGGGALRGGEGWGSVRTRFALAASGGGTGAETPPRPRSYVVRPRWTNRRGARRHGNRSIRSGRPVAPSLQSYPPGGERPRHGRHSEPGNLLLKCMRCPGAYDDAASQGGFSAFATETCEARSARGWRPGVRPTDSQTGSASQRP